MPLSAIQPDRYEQLLDAKVQAMAPRFADYFAGEHLVVPSAPTGFRMRAEFRIWHEGDDLNYVMFRRGEPKQPIPVAEFPIVSPVIQDLMPSLRDALRQTQALRKKLFQVEFLSTLRGDVIVTLIYHRALEDDWAMAAEALSNELGVSIIGRSRKQKIVFGKDWVEETLTCAGHEYHYRQPEQAFTQPNARVNEAMLEWASQQAAGLEDDLLELYCGIGNFTLPLAQHFDHVIATELSKVSTRAAEENRIANQVDNIEFARLSAEEMTEAMDGVRPFRRLAHLKQPLADYKLNTLFVDPPRAGLDPATLSLASRFDNILYISCNPDTLLENLSELQTTHNVSALAFFDQFPYTHHLECGVMLRKH
jgi:tRNA (uracil-5-)-methyltransferase